ncbi:MAG: tetratricopeptide repeat protein [Halioglobus sp.]|nr:tetratricopeptide repeat protein [Halioglobus sp.]
MTSNETPVSSVDPDVRQPNETYFFTTSSLKLALMSVCTFGIYELYWFYKNWVLIKERTGESIMPFWRAFFAPLWAYSCFKKIKASADENRIQESLSIGLLAFFYFMLRALWILPDPFWLISFFSFTLLIPANSVALKINNELCTEFSNNDKFARWNRVGLIFGGLLFTLTLSSTFFGKAAEQSDSPEFMRHDGEGVPPDYAQAVTRYHKAADEGAAEAQFNLGQIYREGQGVPLDYKQAAAWFRKAADQGLAEAQFNLGEIYREGQGVPLDYKEAEEWFRKAADQGVVEAQFNLGQIYREGLGVQVDYRQAAAWFHRAADQGLAEAQFNLGRIYREGPGIPLDYKEAVTWYRKAADQGDPKAQFSLGLRYDNGQGVPQDYAQAVTWYRKAADQGHAAAQYNLGLRYGEGQGVPQDYVQAHMWSNLATASGDQDAITNRDRVAGMMTPAQIAEAQKLAREWKPTPAN